MINEQRDRKTMSTLSQLVKKEQRGFNARKSGDAVDEPLEVIVVVAAGSGGQSAVRDFVQGLPSLEDTTVIIVLVSAGRAMNSESFSRFTSTPVQMIYGGIKIEKGTIYIAPESNSFGFGDNGRFSNTPPALYRSLGADVIEEACSNLSDQFGQKIVVAILSGGQKFAGGIARSVQKISQSGGTVMAQSGDFRVRPVQDGGFSCATYALLMSTICSRQCRRNSHAPGGGRKWRGITAGFSSSVGRGKGPCGWITAINLLIVPFVSFLRLRCKVAAEMPVAAAEMVPPTAFVQ
jgi:hypothetical protein